MNSRPSLSSINDKNTADVQRDLSNATAKQAQASNIASGTGAGQADNIRRATNLSNGMSKLLDTASRDELRKQKEYNDAMVATAIDAGNTVAQVKEEYPDMFGVFGRGGSLAVANAYQTKTAVTQWSDKTNAEMDSYKDVPPAVYTAMLTKQTSDVIATLSDEDPILAQQLRGDLNKVRSGLVKKQYILSTATAKKKEYATGVELLNSTVLAIRNEQDPELRMRLFNTMGATITSMLNHTHDEQGVANVLGAFTQGMLKEGDNTLYEYIKKDKPELLDLMSQEVQTAMAPAKRQYDVVQTSKYSAHRERVKDDLYRKARAGLLTERDITYGVSTIRPSFEARGQGYMVEDLANKLRTVNADALERINNERTLFNDITSDTAGAISSKELKSYDSMLWKSLVQPIYDDPNATPKQKQDALEGYLMTALSHNVPPYSVGHYVKGAIGNATIGTNQDGVPMLNPSVGQAMHILRFVSSKNPSLASEVFNSSTIQMGGRIQTLVDTGRLQLVPGEETLLSPFDVKYITDKTPTGMTESDIKSDSEYKDLMDDVIDTLQSDGRVGDNPGVVKQVLEKDVLLRMQSGQSNSLEEAFQQSVLSVSKRFIGFPGGSTIDSGNMSVLQRAGIDSTGDQSTTVPPLLDTILESVQTNMGIDDKYSTEDYNVQYDSDTGIIHMYLKDEPPSGILDGNDETVLDITPSMLRDAWGKLMKADKTTYDKEFNEVYQKHKRRSLSDRLQRIN